ncbi:hypothetical protein [Filifactor alocis]|uniref:hypothetical protein n=1 Tax=Filifactor alocis TaxID=143361 RepID=UPI003F9F6ABF
MEQKQKRLFSISKEKLVLIAGLVWFIAGYNVMRLGLMSYLQMDEITILYILLSIVVFIPFCMDVLSDESEKQGTDFVV